MEKRLNLKYETLEDKVEHVSINYQEKISDINIKLE